MKSILLISILFACQIITASAQDQENTKSVYENKYYKVYIPEPFEFIVKLDYQQSLDSINSLIKSNPENKELYYYRAWNHYIHHEYFQAFEDINLYLKGNSATQDYYARILLGKLHWVRRSMDQAVSEFNKAISSQPQLPYAYIEKARFYGYSEVTPDLEFIKKTKSKFPEETELHLYEGLMFLKIENHSKAANSFQNYIISKPDNRAQLAMAHLGLAKVNLFKKEYELALSAAQNSITLCSTAVAFGVRGETFYRLNRSEEALKDFKEMQKCCHVSYYNKMIAESYEKTGNIKSACEYYSMACDPQRDRESCNKIKKLKCNTQ